MIVHLYRPSGRFVVSVGRAGCAFDQRVGRECFGAQAGVAVTRLCDEGPRKLSAQCAAQRELKGSLRFRGEIGLKAHQDVEIAAAEHAQRAFAEHIVRLGHPGVATFRFAEEGAELHMDAEQKTEPQP